MKWFFAAIFGLHQRSDPETAFVCAFHKQIAGFDKIMWEFLCNVRVYTEGMTRMGGIAEGIKSTTARETRYGF